MSKRLLMALTIVGLMLALLTPMVASAAGFEQQEGGAYNPNELVFNSSLDDEIVTVECHFQWVRWGFHVECEITRGIPY